MAIQRLDILIATARELAIAKSYSDSHGLQQDFFIAAAQNAILALQRLVLNEVAEVFCAWQEDSIVANQESYSAPSDIFARHMIHQLQYSPDGTAQNYYDLDLGDSRQPFQNGAPEEYFVDGLYTYLWPIPPSAGAKIRRRYEQRLSQVDVPRAVVASTTGTPPAYATIVLAVSPTPDAKFAAGPYQYVTAVDRNGVIKCKAIAVDSYNSGTRTLTMVSGWTGVAGETVSAGDRICFGAQSTTHPALDDCCEDFLVQYMSRAAEQGRSSLDLNAKESDLRKLTESIVEVYAQHPAGKKRIPEHRNEW